MLALFAVVAAVPLAPRKKGETPGPMIYEASGAPGPMIVDAPTTTSMEDDFVAKAAAKMEDDLAEAAAAAAAIKEQTDAIKAEEAKVTESEKAFAEKRSSSAQAPGTASAQASDDRLTAEAEQKMRDDEAEIKKQRDAMRIEEDKVDAASAAEAKASGSDHSGVQDYDKDDVAKAEELAAAADAAMREDEAKIKEQIDKMQAGVAPVQAPAPSPYAVQAPAPESVGVQAPAPEAVGVQAPAPVAMTPKEREAAAAKAALEDEDAGEALSPEDKQHKLEQQEQERTEEETAMRDAEAEKVQAEVDKMEELQQEMEKEMEQEGEKADRREEKAVEKARKVKEDELAERVGAARAAARAQEENGDVEEPSGRASRFSNARKLSKMFLHGQPTDDPEKAGLIVHCFDDTENFDKKWMPSAMRRDVILSNCMQPPRVLKTSPIAKLLNEECKYEFDEAHELKAANRLSKGRLTKALAALGVELKEAWDKDKLVAKLLKAKRSQAKEAQAARAERRGRERDLRRSTDKLAANQTDAYLVPTRSFWSTSVINYAVRSTFGRSGVILAPDHNEVQCAFPADMGTMDSGCAVSHMRMNLEAALQNSKWGGYNEVLVSTEAYLDNLPRSLAAFVFGLRGGEAADTGAASAGFEDDTAGGTAGSYLNFLDFYNLTEADVPLLRVEYDVPFDSYAPDMLRNATSAPGAVFTDVSSSARHLAAQWHNRRRLTAKKRHPTDAGEPKRWLGEGHPFREGAQKLDKQHEQQIKRQMEMQKAKVQRQELHKARVQKQQMKAKARDQLGQNMPTEAELRGELGAERKQRRLFKRELKKELKKAKVQKVPSNSAGTFLKNELRKADKAFKKKVQNLPY